MRREEFFPEFVLLDHNFEIDVDHLAALCINDLFLLLLPLSLFHLEPPLLAVLLDLLYFLQVAALLVARLHI